MPIGCVLVPVVRIDPDGSRVVVRHVLSACVLCFTRQHTREECGLPDEYVRGEAREL